MKSQISEKELTVKAQREEVSKLNAKLASEQSLLDSLENEVKAVLTMLVDVNQSLILGERPEVEKVIERM